MEYQNRVLLSCSCSEKEFKKLPSQQGKAKQTYNP